MNRRHLSWLLRLLIYAMVQVSQYELGDDKDEDEDTDDLVSRIEFATL